MEIRHLKSFKTVVDLGGFGRAAEHLNYAQSSITAHIQAIEKTLGYPLFNRLGNNYVLTEAGERFLPKATEILRIYELSIENFNESDTPTGSLTIGAPESLTVYRLLPVIKEYNQLYPNVDIFLKSANGDVLCDYLRNGEIDVAILLENHNSNHSDLIIKTLSYEPMSLVKSPSNIENEGETILFTQPGCGYRSTFENYLDTNNILQKSALEFSGIEAIKQLLINGTGMSLLPSFAVKAEVEAGQLKATQLKDHTTTTLLAYHKNKWVSPALEVFINLLKEQRKEVSIS
ncbi:LysR family transcriptional regulator [Sporosarcina highlanderae]|uniref:LysR family transcriptional regulator n=1 Tax=Sporosarcina highlanderae TaxID=3035916 RepID=A0ABT8JVI2_9BACL|nr:LysR family transcriptional regulator [Sporosarcina highlanderae]MDN4609183.1 LysR family transcriptional regulator [Sporosarcina highlanderae]